DGQARPRGPVQGRRPRRGRVRGYVELREPGVRADRPLAGGFAFAFPDNQLVAAGSSDAVAGLPSLLRGPLSQPLFILGTVFILAVYFFPGGLAGLSGPLRRLIPASSTERTDP